MIDLLLSIAGAAFAPVPWFIVRVTVLLLAGAAVAVSLGRRSVAVTDGDWRRLLAETAAQSAVHRPVRLARSTAVGTPITWGVFQPVVLIPAGSDEWAPDRRRAVLLHELAHVARLDYATQ